MYTSAMYAIYACVAIICVCRIHANIVLLTLGMGRYILPPFGKLRLEVRVLYNHIKNYVLEIRAICIRLVI